MNDDLVPLKAQYIMVDREDGLDVKLPARGWLQIKRTVKSESAHPVKGDLGSVVIAGCDLLVICTGNCEWKLS